MQWIDASSLAASLADPQMWLSLLTLTLLEIVLGIDNLVFLAILSDRLPAAQRPRARRIGLALALGLRLGLLATLASIMRLTASLFEIAGRAVSWRDLILIGGGLFLIYKGTSEIHARIGENAGTGAPRPLETAGFAGVVAQIALLDIVFSLDSVVTAVGMAGQIGVMMAAVVISVGVMLLASGPVSAFICRHPTVKMLALCFLLLIGTTLVGDGIGMHVPKGYIYAAIGFSILVETMNIVTAGRRPERQTRVQVAGSSDAGRPRDAERATPPLTSEAQ